jgi:amidohydrolase
MPVKNRIAEMQDEVAVWRRDIHEHPELMYDTNRTAGVVAAKLREFGCDEVAEGIGRTGFVGLIKGRVDSKGKVIGLRADMDALPILEATGLPYASKNPGLMHACGHDGHTAMLLGAAKYLAETRNFDGSVAVIFQPAEEGGAGAKAMVDDGLIDRFRTARSTGCTTPQACRPELSRSSQDRSTQRSIRSRLRSLAAAAMPRSHTRRSTRPSSRAISRSPCSRLFRATPIRCIRSWFP